MEGSAPQLDDEFLREVGLGDLPVSEKKKALSNIYMELETRLGDRLVEQMSDAQVDEFEGFILREDPEGALEWLRSNFPSYPAIVSDELQKLKAEIIISADAL